MDPTSLLGASGGSSINFAQNPVSGITDHSQWNIGGLNVGIPNYPGFSIGSVSNSGYSGTGFQMSTEMAIMIGAGIFLVFLIMGKKR
jgi:hypothetical protein